MQGYVCFSLLLVGMTSTASDYVALMSCANDQLSAKMLSEVAWNHLEKGESSVISAFSVMTPLAVLALASEGQTHSEILKAVGFWDDENLLRAHSIVNEMLSKEKGITLTMANRIYVPNGVELNSDLADKASKELGTEVENVDFTNSAPTVAAMNQWVAEKTNNKIVDLINEGDITPNTEMILVNALYFFGRWVKPLSGTSMEAFHRTECSSINVPLMHVSGYFNYANSNKLDAKILEMDYYESDASFVIILPNRISGLASLVNNIEDPSKLREALESVSKKDVDVAIPKFKVETETDLKDILAKVGVKSLFESAELTKLLKSPRKLAVSKAVQKAFISVDEVGTEAAAADKVVLLGSGMPSPQYETFVADHPFVFLIKMRDLILFSGVYNG